MLLAIDIGNSNIVLGVFDNKTLKYHHRFPTQKESGQNDWMDHFIKEFKNLQTDPQNISNIVIASVVPENMTHLQVLCKDHFQVSSPYVISHKTDFHMKIDVDHPEKVGSDRLINAAAAFKKYNTDLIVIDMGTATTLDCIVDGTFIGGIICPGLQMAAQALSQKASQLFDVPLIKPNSVVGKNTQECVQSGLYFGKLGLIDSLVKRIEDEVEREMTVIATGGLSQLFIQDSMEINYYEELLTLEGLKLVYDWNH